MGEVQESDTLSSTSSDLDGGASDLYVCTGGGAAATFGIALIDAVREFVIRLSEFHDDLHLTVLESVLVQMRPRRCVVYLSTKDCQLRFGKKIKVLLQRCHVIYDEGYAADCKDPAEASDLRRILQPRFLPRLLSTAVQQMQLARCALAAALTRVPHLHGARSRAASTEGDGAGHFKFEILDVFSFLRVDKAAFSALQILPGLGERARAPTSLLGFLNRTRTNFGQQRLLSWLTQPSTDLVTIETRHGTVDLFVKHRDIRCALQQSHFKRLPTQLDRVNVRLHKVALKGDTLPPSSAKSLDASLEDVALLNDGLLGVHGMLTLLEELCLRGSDLDTDRFKQRYVVPLRRCCKKISRFHELVSYTLDTETWAREGVAQINASFDDQLKALADRKASCTRRIERHRIEVEQDVGLGSGSVRLVEGGSGTGLAFRVTKKDQGSILSHKTLCRPIRINKAELLFTTSKLTEYLSDFKEVKDSYSKCQWELSFKTITTAATYYPVIEEVLSILADLDVLLGFAELATGSLRDNKGPFLKRPTMHDGQGSRVLRLKGSRHILVEHQLELQKLLSHTTSRGSGLVLGQRSFVENSVDLSEPDRLLNIITGPNMGGKSTYIRQVVLCVLMAQAGCWLPCEEAELSIFDAIYCRVGASDDQLKGVSTFLAEMIETSAILGGATRRSLVVIDELGRGTSTDEGFALAHQVAVHLASKTKCFTLFATHFHELGQLAHQDDNQETTLLKTTDSEKRLPIFASQTVVEISGDTMTFLYDIKPGVADMSYGLGIAELAGIKPSIILEAKQKAAEMEAQNASAAAPSTAMAVALLRECLDAAEMRQGSEEDRVRAFIGAVKACDPSLFRHAAQVVA